MPLRLISGTVKILLECAGLLWCNEAVPMAKAFIFIVEIGILVLLGFIYSEVYLLKAELAVITPEPKVELRVQEVVLSPEETQITSESFSFRDTFSAVDAAPADSEPQEVRPLDLTTPEPQNSKD